ncbi:hypothetical protein CAPTEDRAFT_222477 [Capitella teleta]|uniref:Protein CDV3 homolog n=1 Tax=Capitella teleta TaxID=283909 RepID=R7U819_CAPTE|nr:hypothetical protein CAPTEDRAFT_222477 [Capitella teleta]|eukprot:ELU02129.1 hypothetical protein CAPTEDRAFT_222477 [Capitella teleta]
MLKNFNLGYIPTSHESVGPSNLLNGQDESAKARITFAEMEYPQSLTPVAKRRSGEFLRRMAEKDLDSFFAKKDKSKKKNKSKITIDDLTPDSSIGIGSISSTPTVLTSEKKKKKKSKDKVKDKEPSSAKAISKEEDAEWNDFESEEVDYSGLKIQNLQIASKEEEEVNEEREGNSDTDEDGEKREKGQDGPWNKATGEGALQQEMAHEAPPTRKEEAPAPAPVKSGKYVPPSMRGRTDNPEPLRRVPKSRKVAPDLRNQDEFPSLGANPLPQEIDTDPRQFERVRQGGKYDDSHQRSAPRLQLGNKYASLSNTGD